MARLTISTLGPFAVLLDDQPVTHLITGKVRALLAYLAVEAGRAHRRETLAGLLWPDYPGRSARTNLRNALSNLRRAIGDREADAPFLLVTREAIQSNPSSDCAVDAVALGELASATDATADQLEEAVALYRGPLLEGFSVDDSPAFEDWVLEVRERLERQVLETLDALAGRYEGGGEYGRALEYTRRRVALAPWQESAHQDLMRLLALDGQRGAALAQYEACCRALRQELDVEPGEETARLYARIRDGEVRQEAGGRKQEAGGKRREVAESETHSFPSPNLPAPTRAPPPDAPPLPTAARQRPAPIEGQRRVVTALLADVRGSTALAEQIDVETWVEIMDRVFQILGAEIYRYGGEVDQYRGDGLVAFFGRAAAHEDDPERAVLAALAMQEAVKAYAAELAAREGIDLSLRVGVNTGEVIAATVGERRHREETAMGRAVAVAARMETACEAGTVLVAEGTYRLAASLFEWQSLGEIAVKGIRRPVAVYRPLAHRAIAGKGRGIAGLSSPLVGRDAERQTLRETLDRLQAGIGGIVTVVGEAGIGKSRLVTEVRRDVGAVRALTSVSGEQHLRWVEGRCLSYATGTAYQLWLDMLRSWLGLAPDASPVTVHDTLHERVQSLCPDCGDDVYPYLARMMALPLDETREAKLRGLDAESQRFLTFRAVETLLARGAETRPLVVVCEDLHWADPTSLALLDQLLSLPDRVPLLFVCVLRPERTHGCWQIVEAAMRDYAHCHTGLQLKPLSAADSAKLVGNLLHVDDLPHDLRLRVLDHAEGNPFYVEEILRALIDGEIVVHDEATGRWQATRDVADIPISDTLHGVLAARIDRLPGETRHVLQQASVIGRIFTYPVLAAISAPPPVGEHPEGREEGSLLAHLVALERAQLIRERARLPEREYAFKHHLTQEAAYNGLLRRERRVTHRQVAEALERLYPERLEEQLGLLAHHWEEAGESERAVAYLQRAGEQAAAQFANDEAIDYLSRALALARPDDLETRYVLQLARERVYNVRGAREAQRQELEDLAVVASAMDEDGKRAVVACRQAAYANLVTDYSAATAAVREAVDLARSAGDAECEAQAHIWWGHILRRQDDWEGAASHTERALALARAAGLRQAEAEGLSALSVILRSVQGPAPAIPCAEQAVNIHRQTGDRRGEGNALEQLGAALSMQGDYARAQVRLDEALCVYRETGHRRGEAFAHMWLGQLYLDVGEFHQAEGHLERAMHIFETMDDPFGARGVHYFLGQVFARLGKYREARTHLEQVLGIVFGMLQWTQSVALSGLALLSHYLGDGDAARRYAAQALQTGGPALRQIQPIASTALGHALLGLRRPAEAADAYERGLAILRRLGLLHRTGDPLAGLAQVALAQGDPAGALAHVQEILDQMADRPGLEGTTEPLRIYLTCYQVLRANDNTGAQAVLDAGYRLLQERAHKIEDQDLRRSYLENVPYHREIVAAWKEASG